MYPDLPSLPKTTNESRTLRIRDRNYTVHANTLCTNHIGATNRKPEFWPGLCSTVRANSFPFPVASFSPFLWLESNVCNSSGRAMFTPESGSWFLLQKVIATVLVNVSRTPSSVQNLRRYLRIVIQSWQSMARRRLKDIRQRSERWNGSFRMVQTSLCH